MLNQNNVIPNILVSLNNKISYIITLNLVGDVISMQCRDTVLQNIGIEKIMSNFSRIVTATSLLNFDNVKFLMYEEDNRKHVIVNLQETSIIIGLTRETTVSDVLLVIGEYLKTLQNCEDYI